MKTRALVVVLLGVLMVATLAIGNAEAGFYTCSIQEVSTYANGSTSSYYVQLSDTAASPAFTNQFFNLSPGATSANFLYATMLTAFSNATNVSVWMPEPPTAWGIIYTVSAVK